MLLYWFFGLLLIVPLAGVIVLRRRVVRPYVSVRTLLFWSGLCVVNGLYWWTKYYTNNSTVYAPSYRETQFQQVDVGMSEAQVLALVGKPLEQWRPYQHGRNSTKRHYVGFAYSRSKGGGDYEIRQINFDRGRVAEVVRYRYYD